ncbi:MAG: phosphoenolpyruvate carboxylase [Leptospirales bacterium]
MKQTVMENSFKRLVKNKFNVYNSLFLNLPFHKVSNIGILVPLLQQSCRQGLSSGLEPMQILDSFFTDHVKVQTEQDKIDFMFRIIQYIERQIVLYDSVEDAAFSDLLQFSKHRPLKDYLHIKDDDKTNVHFSEKLSEKLSTFSARIVLTSHPTQFYSPSVLDIMSKLRELIKKNDISGIDLSLHQLGMTSLINTSKPTPLDEAKNVIHLLRNVYYDALGELYSNIRQNLPNESFDNTGVFRLGFWPGGDRDGNPFVTSAITMDVADELRMSLLKCYYHDVKKLSQMLTFREVEEPLKELKNLLYENMFDSGLNTLTYEKILTALVDIKASLLATYNGLYVEELESVIDKVKIFKTHFATMDIRQNHLVHKQTIEAILIENNIITNSLEELPKEKLISILMSKEIPKNLTLDLEHMRDKLYSADSNKSVDAIFDTIENITQLKDIQSKNGEQGCNRYIISNSEDVYSVLFVYALFRWCGWSQGKIPFDIIPLFESMEGIKNSETIMRELFNIPEYRLHLKQRQDEQTIMLGFSDGTKDGGYLKANWSIFKTKETLSALCDEFNIKAVFFDGRGGPPARGGGKTHRFYAAQTEKIANHAIQLTIQGQTITSKYGTKEHFTHNCEQLLTAGLSHTLFEKKNVISKEHRLLIDELSEISFAKYRELKNHSLFLPYLEDKSVLKYYGQTNIGSRPSKRGNKKKLELTDLRAIPFVGSWSQLKQNVPGYFGIGTAIQSLVNAGKLDELKECFKEVPVFRAMLSNSMMSLYKCNFSLTNYIAKDKTYGEFRNILYDEYKLSKEMLLLISEQTVLMQEEVESKNSIDIREEIILPLLIIQQYALQKLEIGFEESDAEKEDFYKKIVKRSLYGNINASRNSA